MITDSPRTDRSTLVQQLIAQHRTQPGPLLPLLHAVQDALGHIPAEIVPAIAAGLNLSRAEVHGVITYYHFFRDSPPGRHVVQICRAEACLACGAEELLRHAESVLGCTSHSTRADSAVTLEPVYCLGQCAQSPAMQIDDRVYARVTPDRFDQLAAGLGLSAKEPA